jgi:hypothetical protein
MVDRPGWSESHYTIHLLSIDTPVQDKNEPEEEINWMNFCSLVYVNPC